MKVTFGYKNCALCFLCALVLLGLHFTSFAMTKDESTVQPAAAVSPSEHSAPSEPASVQWRSFIWEAVPAEWLSNPSESAITEAYQQNGWRPFFVDSDFQLTQGARELLDRLGKMESEGIDPKPYELSSLRKGVENIEQLRLSLRSLDPGFLESRAQIQDRGTVGPRPNPVKPSAANQYAMNSPQIQPPDPAENQEKEKLYREVFRATSEMDVKLAHDLVRFSQEMNPFSREKQIKALLGEVSMATFLKELEPPAYDALRKTYHKYLELAEKFPRPELITDGPSIRPGNSGARVRSVQTRLEQEGVFSGKVTGAYDSTTQEAVKHFQVSHLLDPDGVVGLKTRQWLNMSYRQKAEMAALSMKLLRQSETRQYEEGKFVRINIPQFTLEYHKDGRIQAVHRIIVGKAAGKKLKLRGRWIGENHTPSFRSSIEQVVINPRWYVSDRIRRELDDEIAADPNYLSRLGYVKMSSQYPWGEPRIFQLPGPNNPLGQVKFEFPNPYAVFLHDTPKKYLFQRARRDFSHGCIRMEKAQEFAELLLTDDQNASATKTQSYLESGRQAFIKLQQPVPIIVEYIPVSVNQTGQVVFCGDLYDWFGEDSGKS